MSFHAVTSDVIHPFLQDEFFDELDGDGDGKVDGEQPVISMLPERTFFLAPSAF